MDGLASYQNSHGTKYAPRLSVAELIFEAVELDFLYVQ